MALQPSACNATTCSKCPALLVKQDINRATNLPLTPEEATQHARFRDHFKRFLECATCGNACFQSKRDSIKHGYATVEQAVCRPCGGRFSIHGTKLMAALERDRHLKVWKLWSCPTHGLL
jgi:hypothetical protein